MATATATAHAQTTYAPMTTPAARFTTSSRAAPSPPPFSAPYDFPPSELVDVEPDEEWIQQLQAEQQERFTIQARLMHKEHLADLEAAGPFVTPEMRADLQRRYDDQLNEMRKIQQEELEQHIEMERQERLWSLGQQDPAWDGWERVFEEQANILNKIKRDNVRAREIGIAVDADEPQRRGATGTG